MSEAPLDASKDAGTSAPRPRVCAVIPTYDNPHTLAAVVDGVRGLVDTVIVVDDGSAGPGRAVVDALASTGVVVVTRARNGGKGAAVKDGLREATARGFTHALQVDADGQHDLADAPALLAAARARPAALVLGAPRFDATAPRGRLIGRKITQWWTNLETGGAVIEDPMCGFRVYPLPAAATVRVPADRMDFDIEIAVRMAWAGVPIVNLPVKVRYLSAGEGGVSHFRMVRDNLRISWMHSRLVMTRIAQRLFGWMLRR